jgi:MFS family permease
LLTLVTVKPKSADRNAIVDAHARACFHALIPPKPRKLSSAPCADVATRLSIAANRVAKVSIEHEKNSRNRLAHGRRSERAMKRKICVYVGEELVTRLAAAAEQRGATKSGLVGAALDRFLDVAGDQDDRPGMDERLAQMGQQLHQLTRELKFVGETVAMHARYHLTVTPALPDAAQSAACRTGAARFNEFVTQVARRVDQEKPLILETLDRLAATNAHRFSSADRAPQSAACERVHHADRASMNSCSIAAQVAAVPISSAPPTYPADSDTLHAGQPQGVREAAGRGDQEGTRPPTGARPSGLQLVLRVFLPFAACYYLSYLFRTISALIAGPLTAEFGLSPSSLGLLTSAYFLTFAVAQIPIGIFLDRYGPRQVQAVVLVFAAGGAALFGASDGFLSLLAGRALIGLGVAAALTAGLKATVLWFPKERVALVNGWMVMLGGLGAVTATTPAEWALSWIGWRDLFEWLAMAATVIAATVYLFVPDAAPAASANDRRPFAGLREIYADSRFWRLAPLSATTIGTAWALQGLWAAPWLSDVEGLDRAALVNHLLAMAVALSIGALLLGVLATSLRRRNIQPQAVFGAVAALFIAMEVALILRWPLPSYLSWCFVAAVGAATVLSYAIVADYFPRELAGRANAALNVFHIGGAFLVQELIGIVIDHWSIEGGHHPMIAYQVAFSIALAFQLAAWIWFMWPRTQAASSHRLRRYSMEAMVVEVQHMRT